MIATLAVVAVLASSASPVSPDSRYDAGIPTLEVVTGHPVGTQISTPAEIAAYVEALAAAAPDRTELVTYATSEEGRPLHVLAIGSAERMASRYASIWASVAPAGRTAASTAARPAARPAAPMSHCRR